MPQSPFLFETGRSPLQEGFPRGCVPDFGMVVDPDQYHVARQAREFHQPFRNADSALRIQFDPFGTGIEQSFVIP